MAKIALVDNVNKGTYYHRLEVPMSKLTDRHEIVKLKGFSKNHLPENNYDIIIFNRIFAQPFSYLVNAKRYGVKIILDLDDMIFLDPSHPFYSKRTNAVESEKIIEAINIADVVWVSTDYLAKSIKQYTKGKEVVIYNALDYQAQQWNTWVDKPKLRQVGYVAGSSHYYDYDLLPTGLPYAFCGLDNSNGAYNGLIQKFEATAYPALQYFEYGYFYNMFHVSVAPLKDNPFTKCKSNLKILEAGAASMPIVCSDVESFAMLPEKGGYLVRSKGEMKDKIKRLLTNKNKATDMGLFLNEWTRAKYDLTKQNIIRNQCLEI